MREKHIIFVKIALTYYTNSETEINDRAQKRPTNYYR